MNYFSHFFLDATDNSEYNFGLLLPDFVRNFVPNKRYNLTKSTVNWEFGAEQHFKRDHIFHASNTFVIMQNTLKPILKNAFLKMGVKRYFFVAHIFTEMLIDRILVKENVDLVNAMYSQINQLPTDIKVAYVTKNFPENVQLFLNRLNTFIEVKYLLQYPQNNAMCFSVNRVCMQTKICNEWNTEQNRIFVAIIDECETQIKMLIPALWKEME